MMETAKKICWRSHLASVALFLCVASVAHADDKLKNGNFEQGLSPWWGDGRVVQEHAGERKQFARLERGYLVQENIPVVEGRRYQISALVKTTETDIGAAFAQVSFRGPHVAPGWSGPAAIELEGRTERALFVVWAAPTWRRVSVVVQAPARADQMVLYLRKQDGSGSAAFDDISVVETSASPTSPEDALRAQLSGMFRTPSVEASGALDVLEKLASKAPAAHVFMHQGVAQMQVYVGRGEDLTTLNAASDLAIYLQRATGVRLGLIASDEQPGRGPSLIVGRHNKLVQALVPEAAFEGLGDEGFIIKSVGEHIVIAGRTPRADLYGVNWFLEHRVGVVWPAPNVVHVPTLSNLIFPRQDERQIPRFGYRGVLNAETSDKAWRARLMLNGDSHGPSYFPSPPGLGGGDRSWQSPRTSATFAELLPRRLYGAAHPEWFAGGQVAMMDPEVRRLMAEAIIGRLQKRPDYRDLWFDIHDMDWGWDMDPASRKFADAHGGSPAAPRLDMVIDIAQRVREKLPGARFAFNAYHWSFAPPLGMKVPDHVLVYPMTIQVDYSHALNEGPNAELGREIVGWTKIAKHVLVWDHVANFAGFIQPTPNLYQIGDSIRWLGGVENIQGYFAEGTWNTLDGEFASLRAWLIAHMLWDSDQDVRTLIALYCDAYYGPQAGPLVARYIALEQAAIVRAGDRLGERAGPDLRMYDASFVREADRLFDQAETLAGNESYLSRVRVARLPVDYVALVRRHDLALGGDVERRARFERTLRATRIRQYRQGGRVEELERLLNVQRKTPAPPPGATGVPGKDWFDIQDLSFNRYGAVDIVADPQASDGAAARLPASARGWYLQMKLDKLPPGKRWRLFVVMRRDQAAAAARVGMAPPMTCSVEAAGADWAAGRYQVIEVPGGPFQRTVDHNVSLYVQRSGPANSGAVYVDRVFGQPWNPSLLTPTCPDQPE